MNMFDTQKLQKNLTDSSVWIRLLFMLLYAVIVAFATQIAALLVLVQIVVKLITGDVNARLLVLGHGLSRYFYQIWLYLTFNSEQRPFPFSPWPGRDAPLP
ncbi:MAG: DUF4389 domain-containing protein [Gammaproteobacteria bacterium]